MAQCNFVNVLLHVWCIMYSYISLQTCLNTFKTPKQFIDHNFSFGPNNLVYDWRRNMRNISVCELSSFCMFYMKHLSSSSSCSSVNLHLNCKWCGHWSEVQKWWVSHWSDTVSWVCVKLEAKKSITEHNVYCVSFSLDQLGSVWMSLDQPGSVRIRWLVLTAVTDRPRKQI